MAQVKYLITLILYLVLDESLHPRQKHRARAIRNIGCKALVCPVTLYRHLGQLGSRRGVQANLFLRLRTRSPVTTEVTARLAALAPLSLRKN